MDFDFPATVDAIDTVPEGFRGLYKETDGKFALDTSFIEKSEPFKTVKGALSKANKESEATRRQVKAWEALGKTAEEIQALLDAQATEEQKKAEKAGEWDKLKGQMNEKHQTELKSKDEQIGKLRSTLEKHMIDSVATAEIAAAKGVPTLLLPHVQRMTKVVEDEAGNYTVQVVNAKGEPRVDAKGEPLTIKDLVEEMKQAEDFGRAFEGSGTKGSGMQPGNDRARGSKLSSTDKMDPIERLKRARASGS